MSNYKDKYLKYKTKYLKLKLQQGGNDNNETIYFNIVVKKSNFNPPPDVQIGLHNINNFRLNENEHASLTGWLQENNIIIDYGPPGDTSISCNALADIFNAFISSFNRQDQEGMNIINIPDNIRSLIFKIEKEEEAILF